MNLVLGFRRNDDLLTIIEQTREAVDAYDRNYHGSSLTVLKPEHIEALQNGKALAWNDGEYCDFIVLEQEEKSTIDYFCSDCERPFKASMAVSIVNSTIMVTVEAMCPNCGTFVASGCEAVTIEPETKEGE